MLVKIASIATTPPVSLAQAKLHCVIDEDDTAQDAALQLFLDSAIEYVEQHTGLQLAAASLQQRLDCWPAASPCDPAELDAAPVRDVTSIAYVNEAGIEQTLGAEEWAWELTVEGADVWLTPEFTRPALHARRRGCVRINFDAGFDDPNQSGSGSEERLKLPNKAQLMVLQLTKTWYENRDAVIANESKKAELAAQAIGDQLRIYR